MHTPPKTGLPCNKKVDSIDIYFDTKIPDPYRWLENDTSDATAAWIEAQNKVTAKYLEAIPFHRKLLKRITTLSDYERIDYRSRKEISTISLKQWVTKSKRDVYTRLFEQ